jgi:hypothetical protein
MAQESLFIDCKICGNTIEVLHVEAELAIWGTEEKCRADCPACGATNYYLEVELYRSILPDTQGSMKSES